MLLPLRQTNVRICSDNTLCVQIPMDSRNRTIHNVYHISLHSSSNTEPTHKSIHDFYNKEVQIIWFTTRLERATPFELRGVEVISKPVQLARRCTSRRRCMRTTHIPTTSTIKGIVRTPHRAYTEEANTRSSAAINQYVYTNDPSAGSPTETLLRLLLPLSDKVYTTLYCNARRPTIAQV